MTTQTPAPSFVHLRLHSEFSVVDGILHIDDAVDMAKADGMPALALTDLDNLFGMVKFYKACRGSGIKPIIGCDVWLSNPEQREQPHRVLLLCLHREGYRQLCELVSRAYRQNMYRGRGEIHPDWFDEMPCDGLMVLSGGQYGDVGQLLLSGKQQEAAVAAQKWSQRFPQRYYLELHRTQDPQSDRQTRAACALAVQLKLPVVATHPIQFAKEEDFKAHEARVCIAEGNILGDQRRPRKFTEDQYFLSSAQMAERFADLPAALANSVEIAKRCNLTVELGKPRLPLFPTPDNMPLDDYMRQQSFDGLKKRMAFLYPDEAERQQRWPEYEKRLEFEINTIIQMGFSGYFLIVADFIMWAKNNGVPVGPGRGSGAGSLVAYCLGITDLDPLRYALLFERFLNPERVSMPDFDVDFCQDGRERVINYVKDAYGHDAVSQIATFGTMAAKAVIRDVGRVLDLPYNFVDQLSKLIPNELGISLAKAREMEPLINERAAAEEEVSELLQLAESLEGMTRNIGMHAGGVLIAPGKLTDFTPLYCADGSTSVVSQFDKDDVEQAGLVKFDFLGLRTLTIIDWAVRFIKRLHPDIDLNIDAIPLDDKDTYEKIFRTANTTAVFQFESRGMKDTLVKARPDRLDDLIALNALYRPGPMDFIPDYINRKHGREKVIMPHPLLEPVLSTTYGIMVYQEQVMQAAQFVANYTLGGADLLRRAMGKKKPEEMAQQRAIFVTGAAENNIDEAKANEIFDTMEKFAGYGFNKSHAAAYSVVAYQTAYLKCHFPSSFMAATMSSEMDSTDKVQFFYQDCLANNLVMLPPDINQSNYRFEPVSDTEIRYGLGAIKGTGENAINAILEARKDGPFKDLFDFCCRVDKRIVNRRTLESLIRAGAFDTITDNRASLMASIALAMETAEQAQAAASQVSLFGEATGTAHQHELVDVPEWQLIEKLAQEKLALGYYFSGHPFEAYKDEVAAFAKTRLCDIAPRHDHQLLCGIIISHRTLMTRRGKMAFVLLDDGSAQLEVAVYNEMFERHRNLLKEDQLLIVEGKVSNDEYSGGMRISADSLYDLAGARAKFVKHLQLIGSAGLNPVQLKELLLPFRDGNGGGCPIRLAYNSPQASCQLLLGDSWRVLPHEELVPMLQKLSGLESANWVY